MVIAAGIFRGVHRIPRLSDLLVNQLWRFHYLQEASYRHNFLRTIFFIGISQKILEAKSEASL